MHFVLLCPPVTQYKICTCEQSDSESTADHPRTSKTKLSTRRCADARQNSDILGIGGNELPDARQNSDILGIGGNELPDARQNSDILGIGGNELPDARQNSDLLGIGHPCRQHQSEALQNVELIVHCAAGPDSHC
jgi:hypothetical protein